MIRLLFLLVCLLGARGILAQPNVAFFYGKELPVDELRAFDVVVVDPLATADPVTLNTPRSELFAYVSVGEVRPTRGRVHDIPPQWLIGENPAWGSRIIDQAQSQWPEFFVERMIAPLWERGFRGFFFDTLDSYRLVATNAQQRAAQEHGLIRIIELTKARYPQAKLILNRGFEILPKVAGHAYAIAAESLFFGWSQRDRRYIEIAQSERDWLVGELAAIKARYRVPVIAIDYIGVGDRARARETASKIKALGFIPWVANADLDQIGVGAIEVMPRKVLMLYDREHSPNLTQASIHRLATMPLNYLGYVADYRDIGSGLPEYPLVGRYAGIVTWFHAETEASARLLAWLGRQASEGMRIAMFDSLGAAPGDALANELGIHAEPVQAEFAPPRLVERRSPVGYEIDPIVDGRRFMPVQADRAQVLLRLESASGKRMDAVAYTPWGGYALSPYAAIDWVDGEHERWVVNPIEFLAHALRLPNMPVPDTTTENGRRLLLVHVDGDGFANRAWMPRTPFASEVLLREVLERYRIPTTMSVIQGETAANGLYPQFSPELEKTARAMFALPHVELASHSYSHPFKWRRVGAGESGQFNLGIPGYVYDAGTEIAGSLAYIDTTLAPPGKKSKIFLWSGDTDPDEEALAETARAGVHNMNGGNTTITNSQRTLTLVAPLGIQKGQHYQVYAPNQNENVYTNLWTGPYYGFERVIETFQLTEAPLRLKPINIYYHTYSASRLAGLKALKKVYDWALAQPVLPVYASDYIEKVLDFNRIVVARADDRWLIRGAQRLRQMRIAQADGYPDLDASTGALGWREHGSERYLHLSGADQVSVRLAARAGPGPYLLEANGAVTQWERQANALSFGLRAHVALEFALGGLDGCAVVADGKALTPRYGSEGAQFFRLEQHVVERVVVTCPR